MMLETVLGFLLGVVFSALYPDFVQKTRDKVVAMIKQEPCQHDKDKEDKPFRKR